VVSGTADVVLGAPLVVAAALVSGDPEPPSPEQAPTVATATIRHANRFPIAAPFPLCGL
jgi:hypothetical protein